MTRRETTTAKYIDDTPTLMEALWFIAMLVLFYAMYVIYFKIGLATIYHYLV